MPSRSHGAGSHGMYSGRAHSTRHHLTRTRPVEEIIEEHLHPHVHQGHGAGRLRHLHDDFELEDRFRRGED